MGCQCIRTLFLVQSFAVDLRVEEHQLFDTQIRELTSTAVIAINIDSIYLLFATLESASFA